MNADGRGFGMEDVDVEGVLKMRNGFAFRLVRTGETVENGLGGCGGAVDIRLKQGVNEIG